MEMCDEMKVVHGHVTVTGVGRYSSRFQLLTSFAYYKNRVSYAISLHHRLAPDSEAGPLNGAPFSTTKIICTRYGPFQTSQNQPKTSSLYLLTDDCVYQRRSFERIIAPSKMDLYPDLTIPTGSPTRWISLPVEVDPCFTGGSTRR